MMEEQCSPLSWGYYYQEEGIEEFRQALLYTTLELETTIVSAKEEITRRECELIHLKDLLSRTIKERDEAQAKCQQLVLEKVLLEQQLKQKQQQQLQHPQQHLQEAAALTTSSEDGSKGSDSNKQFSSSDCDENIMVSQYSIPILQPSLPLPLPQEALKLAARKPLPEKGKLLKAVMEAGPLLQTLLLAGPLPQWQHPPPQLNSIEIPPVAISSPRPGLMHQESCISSNDLSKKRDLLLCDGSVSSPNTKYQKVMLH